MATRPSAADLETAVRALITAEKTNLGIEVTVPVAYGDGEPVTAVVEAVAEGYRVHDAGFSAMRLTGAGVKFTTHVVHRLNEFAKRYRCAFVDGRVTSNSSHDDLALTICLVANASRSVADYVYELRRQADYDFREIVFDRIREAVGDRVRPGEDFIGESGRHYKVPILLNAAQSRPQNFLATLANRNAVPERFAMFYDLRVPFPDVERDAIYGEDAGVKNEDRALLSSVGAQMISILDAPRRFRVLVAHS